MTKRFPTGPGVTRAAIAAGIGSAAIAAAVLYANHRKDKKKKAPEPPAVPSGEPPETD